jgi:hypothetical protein
MADSRAGLICPGCEQTALAVIGYQQALCGNDECPVLIWNPAKTLVELMADIHRIDPIEPTGGDAG